MKQTLLIRGVPRSLARDAWWFGGDIDPPTIEAAPSAEASDPKWRMPLLALAALVLLGDLLFWRQHLGVSLIVFAWAVFFTIAYSLRTPNVAKPAALLGLATLPAIEYVQLLSVVFLLAGLLASLAWLHLPPSASMKDVAHAARDLLRRLPTRAIRDVLRIRPNPSDLATGFNLRSFVQAWALPVGGGLLLLSLLLRANPILDAWLTDIVYWRLDWDEVVFRVLFWSGLAMLVWPLLTTAPEMRDSRPIASRLWHVPGVNSASVLRALVTFNLLIAVQTLLDLFVLFGGGGLPEGVTYSEYARQGAFPLLAITLLGGAFALSTRAVIDEHRALRPLLYAWLFQTILISAGALQRLVLYVDAYGLTYLRLHTLIWIPVIALGLGLTAWQVYKRRSNLWLVVRAGGLAFAMAYASCFVNFAGLIAAHNLQNDKETDWSYLIRRLPDPALPNVRAAAIAEGCPDTICDRIRWSHREIRDWRGWDFRSHRIDRRMAALDQVEQAQ